MLSLHPRYPVLKVPAPARLSAAVAQGLMMPEDRPPGGGNIGLHILYTYGEGRGALYSTEIQFRWFKYRQPIPSIVRCSPRHTDRGPCC